jgi:adenylyltransferase/sulfurtransferase
MVIDIWDNRIRQVSLESLRASGCPACRGEEFPWLEGRRASHSAILCGRNAVQLSPAGRSSISLETLAQKLSGVGQLTSNRYLLRLTVDDYILTIFPDGRAIIGGTDDIAAARTLFAKYIGN